ncbi:MAG: hypothetical protein HYY16_02240 [Planctomycetes bacterium]|nr:hypothetical protein [Planctomycetota bacterium]
MRENFELGPLGNADLAPTSGERHTWNRRHIAPLRVGMAVCIPTYLRGAELLQAGIGEAWKGLFTYAWFVGFAIAFALYSIYGNLQKLHQRRVGGVPFDEDRPQLQSR